MGRLRHGKKADAAKMRALFGCEHSGTIRDAFARLGHYAVSCDLLPSETPGNHYQGDIFDIINDGWDLMIAHPPCTYLSVSGMHWTTRGFRDPQLTVDALQFFERLLDAPIPEICLENPISVVSTRIRRPDQIIHPWQFGHSESKATALWLKGLPLLKPTNILPKPESGRWDNQTASGQNKLPPSADRWKLRSKTYQGIAEAMASQWGAAGRIVDKDASRLELKRQPALL